MDAALIRRAERNLDRLAAALFAGACAFAAHMGLARVSPEPIATAEAAAVAAVAFLVGLRVLAAVKPAERLPFPMFDVRDFEPSLPEMVLDVLWQPKLLPAPSPPKIIEAPVVAQAAVELAGRQAAVEPSPAPAPVLELTEVCASPTEEELILEDVLAKLGPDSRVVRLFDPSAMPTAGQLNARIRNHLSAADRRQALQDAEVVDASQALHDALSELRRSLR